MENKGGGGSRERRKQNRQRVGHIFLECTWPLDSPRRRGLHPKRGYSSVFPSVSAPPSSPSSSCLGLRPLASFELMAIPSMAMPPHVIPKMVPRLCHFVQLLLLYKKKKIQDSKAPLRTDRLDDTFYLFFCCILRLPPRLCSSRKHLHIATASID